ncbi:methyltransferase [Novosphingobium profundi]|uniref:methyltransferase n=1 Tax=Novosphingobium profundi TaxID=1774954 RepID=UPI001BD92A7D|nr:methyltransferase [Novosphingobium profundi]MBT0669871.1 methyltransferase [Novosphingobium profundi]
MIAPRGKVERAFAGAERYEENAPVQREVARALAARIAALSLPAAPRLLEIGCGTGFLTSALLEAGLRGDWLVTDLSPAMLERCRARIGEAPGRRFAPLDGEHGDPGERGFDLIVSSLAMQWFDAAPTALERLRGWLAPGGHLVVTTLGAGTFAEWRAAHAAQRLTPGTPRFLPPETFAALPQAQVSVDEHRQPFADARAFLRAVKAIGAGTAHPDHVPLAPADLRAVMAQFEGNGSTATYEVVTIHLTSTR